MPNDHGVHPRHGGIRTGHLQSGERIRGRGNMRAYQAAYPGPPAIQPRRLVGGSQVWVAELRADYGAGRIWHAVNVVECRDGMIRRETRWYAEPFAAPAWRAPLVEPMATVTLPRGDPGQAP